MHSLLTDGALANGNEALNWFISITSASFFINWAIVAYTSFRFRAAVRAQNIPMFDTIYAWKLKYWPLEPTVSLVISTILLASVLFAAISPPVRGWLYLTHHFPSTNM